MPLHRSGSRRALLRKQLIILGVVVCVAVVSAVAWQRHLRVRELRRPVRGATPGATSGLADSTGPGGGAELLTSDVRVTDMVREVLTRARKTLSEAETRPSVFVLSEGGSADAMPLLESIIQDRDENDLLRGDALHALFYLDQGRAASLAESHKGHGGHLASVAQRILSRDPVMLERLEN
ncbi:MAG: hypothetical protein GY851_24580, partial [bacterium]|nr:hypothetical protein [bacterium]